MLEGQSTSGALVKVVKARRKARAREAGERERAAIRAGGNDLLEVVDFYFKHDAPHLRDLIVVNLKLVQSLWNVVEFPQHDISKRRKFDTEKLTNYLENCRHQLNRQIIENINKSLSSNNSAEVPNINRLPGWRAIVEFLAQESWAFRYYPVIIEKADNILDEHLRACQNDLQYHNFALEGILDQNKCNSSKLSTVDRFERLKQYAAEFGDDGLEELARILFPEWSFREHESAKNVIGKETALPDAAPASWKHDKQQGETPPDFIKRVYGEWLGKGLDRATVRRLDPSLGVGLDNWLRNNALPGDVDLPTRGEQNRRILEAGGEALASHLEKFSGREAVREIDRLRNSSRKNR